MEKGKIGGGGQYFLYSGNVNSAEIPVGNNIIWINHTHPAGTRVPSVFDHDALKSLINAGSPQKSSVILPVKSSPVRFNLETPYLTPKPQINK